MPRKQAPKHTPEAADERRDTEAGDEFWMSVFELLAELDQLYVQIQRVLDILPSETRALLAVWHAGGLAAGELAKRTKLSAQATTTLIDRLESRRLVERTRHPENKRFVIVRATPTAHERLASVGRLLQARHDLATTIAPRSAQQAQRGIEPLRRLIDETTTIMRLTPIEVFPASLDRVSHLPISAFQMTDET